jgi:periplasmic protein TonB
MIAMQRSLVLGACLIMLSPGLAQQEKAKAATASQEIAVEVGPGITPPHPVFSPVPDYPEWLRKGKHKNGGTCVLGLTVDKEGLIRDVHVTRSSDKRLDQNAIDTVKQWRFNPAMRDGKPVSVLTSVEVDFRLY